jgi:hypothetical protein
MMRMTEDEIALILNMLYKQAAGLGFSYRSLVNFILVRKIPLNFFLKKSQEKDIRELINLEDTDDRNASKLTRRGIIRGNAFKLSDQSIVVKKMVSMSMSYGADFLTKAIDKMDRLAPFDQIKHLLTCLNIPMNLEEEAEFREFLISKNMITVNRNDMLLDVELSVDTYKLCEMLKAKIRKLDPKADFSGLREYPEEPTSFLNNFKQSLMSSCLDDLETRAKIFKDRDGYITEVKLKEIFEDIFPNFSQQKLDSFLTLIDNKKPASARNDYQEKFNIFEIMLKIRQGASYQKSQISNFKSSVRILVEKVSKKNSKKNKLNGEFVPFGKPEISYTKRVPQYRETMIKLKEILELIKQNEKMQERLTLGLTDSEKLDKEKMPLTMPLIKIYLDEDRQRSGKMTQKRFVNILVDYFPTIKEGNWIFGLLFCSRRLPVLQRGFD